MIPTEQAHLHVAALNDPGRKGKNNEDRYAVSSYHFSAEDAMPSLFAIVADGIGGHLAGEVAAEMVVDYVSQAVAESNAQTPLKTITRAVESANQAIVSKAKEERTKQGMGATCVCAWVIGDRLYTGSVGDSRIYLMRGAAIQQLSTDHTWIQEAMDKGILTPAQARGHPNVHVIRRYIGSAEPPEVDFRLRLNSEEDDAQLKANQGVRLQAGDTLLLCSDGLTDLVWNDEILEIVRAAQNLEKAAQKLIDLANERGGHDNITVVLLSVPNGEGLKRKQDNNSLLWIIGGMAVFLAVASVLIGLIWNLIQPDATPTPTLAQIATASPVIETTVAPPTATMLSTLPPPTSTLAPTSGPTYTPWPTNEP